MSSNVPQLCLSSYLHRRALKAGPSAGMADEPFRLVCYYVQMLTLLTQDPETSPLLKGSERADTKRYARRHQARRRWNVADGLL